MSINNGRQQRNISATKKACNNAAPANAVYPILRPAQKAQVVDVVNGISNGSRLSRGQCLNPKRAVEPHIVSSVAEFVSDVIPQTSSPANAQHEQIQWVKIQKCSMDDQQRRTTFIVMIGLVRGYQIWMMLDNGVCEEVVSERRGPLKAGHLLPPCDKQSEKFFDFRPLFALVDGNPMCENNKFCTVDFLSLKTGRTVYCLKYNEPVMDLASTNDSFIVVLSESIIIYDNGSLNELFSFMISPSVDPSIPPAFSISDCFLGFADTNLNTAIQSCGGRIEEVENSYSSQMISAAKSISKTMSSIGESLVSTFSNPANEKRKNVAIFPGVVSVINLRNLPRSNEKRFLTSNFVAHFVAHKSAVSHIAFGNGGRLLFTSNERATTFNIFILQPHPVNCRLGSVQHIYTLRRGNSAAKVIDTAFTIDNRWLAVGTNHGTTHIFGLCPYGGNVCMRTHGGRFIRESSFERTAGLNAENQVSYNVHSKQKTSPTFVDHPALLKNPIVSRTVVNPRITRFPSPIVFWSLAKIKQHAFSAENLSAWASDNTPVSLANSGRQQQIVAGQPFFESQRRLALCFGTVYGDQCASIESPILFIMNADGTLHQYKMEICRERLNSSSSVSSLNNDINGLSSSAFYQQHNCNGLEASGRALEAPIQIRTFELSQWSLTRGRGTSGVNFVCPPLHESSPILKVGQSTNLRKFSSRKGARSWLHQVEVKTYSEPHRRLWLGPQFTFGIYTNTKQHASTELMSPSVAEKPAHLFTTAQKCCPVLIEKNSNIGILRCDTSMNSTSRIVCGSWSSDSVYGNDPLLANLKEQLEDAMRD